MWVVALFDLGTNSKKTSLSMIWTNVFLYKYLIFMLMSLFIYSFNNKHLFNPYFY